MGIRDLLKKHSSKSSNASAIQFVPCRTITVQTNYGSLKITNLKRVWCNEYLGTYRLMYSDDEYNYNCIYWSDMPCNEFMHFCKVCKDRLIEAYNNGDSFIEL